MASLSIARPGRVSERQYLGDLACLFDRQRARAGLALTPESFASDLAANDSLRSSLFTLCGAISRMGEQDLSPEELLNLVARALTGQAIEDEAAPIVPVEMRDAFLSGYAAWQDRGLEPFFAFDATWPPSNAGKAAARERQPLAPPGVIPFPAKAAEDPTRAPSTAPSARSEMLLGAADDRPPGIDALVAAAPVWANAVPAARSADKEGSLSRRAALSARRLFVALAGVTAVAAAIAGFIAYRTLY
jgi:hypothetical protein